MGFPTRACMELTSDDAMKQSLRLVKDVSLSMSWNAESLPVEDRERRQDRWQPMEDVIHRSGGKLESLTVTLKNCSQCVMTTGRKPLVGIIKARVFAALAGTIGVCEGTSERGASPRKDLLNAVYAFINPQRLFLWRESFSLLHSGS